jgi:hypothetical protein
VRVRVSFTVEVDAQAWAGAYGLDVSEVRQDVNTYALSSMLAHIDDNGLGEG